MTESVEVTGKNVDAAIAAAEQRFGVSRDELEIRVISQGSRGVFGLGSEPARILVQRHVAEPVPPPVVEERPPPVERVPPPVERVPPPVRERTVERRPGRPVEVARTAVREPAPEAAPARGIAAAAVREPETADVAAAAEAMLAELLGKMGFRVEVSAKRGTDPLVLDVHGDSLGILIGHHGESLTALQFMLNLMLSKRFHRWPHVVVDVEGYRSRREQSLRALAHRVAQRVRRNRRAFTLEAMPANDRRIIHLALKDRSDIETYSIGEGTARRVVVAPRR